MKTSSLLVLLVSAGLSLVACASTPEYNNIPRVDNFDTGKPFSAVDATALGFLKYNAFVYTPLVLPKPPSGKQIITTGLRAQELEGQAAFLPINGKVYCFDLKSVRNGCIANTQAGVASVPVSCTVQFSGRSAKTGQVKTKPVVYNPGWNPNAAFNTTFFAKDDFSCLDRVDVTLISAVLPAKEATVGTGFDDVSYNAWVMA